MDVNTTCPRCAAPSSSIVRDGFFWRADDSKYIQRFLCKSCGKKFSAATTSALPTLFIRIRATQRPLCKTCLCRRIGHTSSKHNAVRVAAVSLPMGETVCIPAGVVLS
jgi:transposase-like protein